MPTHDLSEGREVIAGLVMLGRAMGYTVEEEREIGKSGAAVDVAWYAAGDCGVPLMIFEVESNATASMANNAMKVLSRDVDDFVKPLFFFHVLLSGGPDNDRIAGLRRQWGSHNYRVYRFNDDPEVARLICDICSQHRRINNYIDVGAVASALAEPPWNRATRQTCLRKLRTLGLQANYLGTYAVRGINESDLRDEYLHRLGEVLDGRAVVGERENYGGAFLGDAFPNLIEVALLIRAEHVPKTQAVDYLENWQNSRGYMRLLAANLMLSAEYDQMIIGVAPFVYAVAGLLLRPNTDAYTWLVADMYSILRDERERWNISEQFAMPTALWLAHLAASGNDWSKACNNDSTVATLTAAFNYSAKVLDEGISQELIDAPPSYVDIEDPYEWAFRCQELTGKRPTPKALGTRYKTSDPPMLADPVGWALALLTSDDWPGWSTNELVVALYRAT